jgi:hypothetical protein
MNAAASRAFLMTSFFIYLAIVPFGCVGNGSGKSEPRAQDDDGERREPGVSWDSPKMRKIELEWRSIWDTYDQTPDKIPAKDGKTRYVRVLEMIEHLLRAHLSKNDLLQLVATCETLPVRERDRSQFACDVLAHIVTALAELEDRETLVELLSKRCPSHVGLDVTIEFYLADCANRVKDPIFILGEAYTASKVPEVRHDLAAAVRRGFADLGIRAKEDPDFVAKAMLWYTRERDHLIVNRRYRENEARGLLTVLGYERHPEWYENPPADHPRQRLFQPRPR